MSEKHGNAAPRIVLVGGGSGGHVYPALAVMEALLRQRPRARFLFIGGDRMEARLVPEAGVPFHRISVHGLAGRGLSAWSRRLRSLLELAILLPLWQSLLVLRRFRPQVVIGTGGYVCGPVLLAARILRIPSLALEGNRTVGLTSRLVSRLVDAMAVGHVEQSAFFEQRVRRTARVAVTGLPVRSKVVDITRHEGAAALGLDPSLLTLLVLGGSLGSQPINDALVGALKLMSDSTGSLKKTQVVHVVGEKRAVGGTLEEIRSIVPGYRPVQYLANYPEALAAADLVIARAGAGTVAELAARGTPAILIPWSGASAREQEPNAEALRRVGGAVVLPDDELSAATLARVLSTVLWDSERREVMGRAAALVGRPNAAQNVAAIALELVGEKAGSGGEGEDG